MKFFLILLVCSFSAYSSPLVESYLNYKTLSSTHFYIHFPEEYAKLAKKILIQIEEIHKELSPIYKDKNPKTHLVLIIRQDLINAFTEVQGLDLIILYLTQPLVGEFANYENWIEQLLRHEYTHVLTLRNYQGFWNYLFRFFFGAPPNLALPAGILEGVSVLEESQTESIGRLKDTNTSSILRQQLLYHKFPTLEEVLGGSYYWPLGQIPYLYGSRYLHTIFEIETKEKFLEIFHSKSLPIFLRSRFTNNNLKNPENYYKDFIKKEYDFLKEFQNKKWKSPITYYEQITTNGGFKEYLKIYNNKIYYFEKSSYRSSGIYNLEEDLVYKASYLFDFSIEENDIITSEIQTLGNFTNTSLYLNGNEIIFYELEPHIKKSKWFPIKYKNFVFFIEILDEKPKITKAKINWDFMNTPSVNSKEIVFEANPLDVIHFPILADNKIFFIHKKNDSSWHSIKECDFYTFNCKSIIEIPYSMKTLHYNSKQNELLFSSNLDGNYEIYSINLENAKIFQLTNSLLSLKSPLLDPSYLYVLGETYKGYDIFRIPKNALLYKEIDLSSFKKEDIPKKNLENSIIEDTYFHTITNYHIKNFHFYLDGVFSNFNTEYALQISGFDPLKRHILNFGIGKLDLYTLYFLNYSYNRFLPFLDLSYWKTNPFSSDKDCFPLLNSFYRNYFCKILYGLESYSIALRYPYNFRLIKTMYSLGFSNKKNRNLNSNKSYSSLYNDIDQKSIFFNFDLSYYDFYYFSISPENGFRFQIRTEYFPSFWNFVTSKDNSKIPFDYLNISSRIEFFFPWFLNNHVPYFSLFVNYNIGKDRDIIRYNLANYQNGLNVNDSPYGKGNIVMTWEYRFPFLYLSKRILWFLPEVSVHWISLAPFYEIGKSFDKSIYEKDKKTIYSKGIRSDWKVYIFYLPFFLHFIYAKGTEEQFSWSFSLSINFHTQVLHQKLHGESLPQTYYYK